MVQGGPKKNSELNELHGNPGNRKGKAEPEEKVGNAENYRYIVPTYLRGDQKRYVKPDILVGLPLDNQPERCRRRQWKKKTKRHISYGGVF